MKNDLFSNNPVARTILLYLLLKDNQLKADFYAVKFSPYF